MKDMKVRLSTLWIFAVLNYLYADVLTLMDPVELRKIMADNIGPFQMTQGFLLGAGILMETAIVMVLFSRLLNYRANRLANIIAGIIHTAAVFSSMFVGKPSVYYLFFGIIEITCTLFIIGYAWRWSAPGETADNIN